MFGFLEGSALALEKESVGQMTQQKRHEAAEDPEVNR